MHVTNLSFQQARPKEISVWLKFGCMLFEIRLYVNDDMATKGDVCVAGYVLPNTRNVLPPYADTVSRLSNSGISMTRLRKKSQLKSYSLQSVTDRSAADKL